jgi:hypothetical protein
VQLPLTCSHPGAVRAHLVEKLPEHGLLDVEDILLVLQLLLEVVVLLREAVQGLFKLRGMRLVRQEQGWQGVGLRVTEGLVTRVEDEQRLGVLRPTVY